MEKEYIKASEYANKMSLHIRTVYRYYHNGKIMGYQDDDTGTIFIKNPFKKQNDNKIFQNKVILYSRVSSSENKNNLDNQLERLRLYAVAKGYQIIKEVKEIGSGLNDNRTKLNEIFEKDLNKFEILLVEHKDRLTRFGFNYIELFLKSHNKKIEIINAVNTNKEDLIQDFISIITLFCTRIYGQRCSRRKTEKLIKELKNDKEKNR